MGLQVGTGGAAGGPGSRTNMRWLRGWDWRTIPPTMKHHPRHALVLFLIVLIVLLALPGRANAQTGESTPKARPSPGWLRSSIVYQVFPRSFSAAGNFDAITTRMNELHELGVDILWLMPIHPIGEARKKGTVGSPYAVRDFRAINPAYGTAEDLRELVDRAHQLGMRVVLDIVTGHTAWDSVLMAHPEFYRKDENGTIQSPFPDWSDVAALDYENEALRRYMIDMMKYWLKEFQVDGFRCDVAFAVPIDFWLTVRKELTAINPEVILFADADAKPQLLLEAFDMDNSWPLMYAMNRVMSGHYPATLLKNSWENSRRQFPAGALHMRMSDGQPEPRAVVRYGMNGALAAQVIMLTLDGVPLFYNGMEVGDATPSADPALFERVPVYWTTAGRPPLREIYSSLLQLRKAHPAFHNDVVNWVETTNPAEIVSFMREDDAEAFIILVNLSSRPVHGSVLLPEPDAFAPVTVNGVPTPATEDFPDFRLGGYEWHIYQRVDTDVGRGSAGTTSEGAE